MISLGEGGRLADFEMNDTCAAGTGTFPAMVALITESFDGEVRVLPRRRYLARMGRR